MTSYSDQYAPILLHEAPAAEWDIRRYLRSALIVCAVSVPFLVAGLLAGRPLLAVAPFALVVLAATVIKPEVGLLAMLVMMPLEDAMVVVPQTLTVLRVLGIYVLGVFVLHGLAGKRVILNEPFIRRHAILVLAVFLSALMSRQPILGMFTMQTQLAFVVFTVLAISLIQDWRMVENAIVFLFIGSVTGAVCGLMREYLLGQSLAADRISASTGRLALAEMSNPNAFSRAVGVGVLTLPYLWWRFRSLATRGMLLAGLLLVMAAIVKSQTRTVWVAMGVALPAAFWFSETRVVSRSAKMVFLAVVAAIALGVGVRSGFFSGDIVERFRAISEGVRAGGRLQIWKVCFAAFLDHPLLGMGHKMFGYYSVEVALEHGMWLPGDYSRDPHSNYMAALAEWGGIGFLAYMAVLFYIARSLWRFTSSALRGAMVGMFVFVLITGLAGTNTNRKSYWMPIAVMAAAITVHRRTLSEAHLAGLEGDDGQAG